jgi:hypothetical protein
MGRIRSERKGNKTKFECGRDIVGKFRQARSKKKDGGEMKE